ncbi:unnamed protein product [Closterium sp. Naga37s-1]|nr:unnamed protein product [Closterium sp. Naga37s-1]
MGGRRGRWAAAGRNRPRVFHDDPGTDNDHGLGMNTDNPPSAQAETVGHAPQGTADNGQQNADGTAGGASASQGRTSVERSPPRGQHTAAANDPRSPQSGTSGGPGGRRQSRRRTTSGSGGREQPTSSPSTSNRRRSRSEAGRVARGLEALTTVAEHGISHVIKGEHSRPSLLCSSLLRPSPPFSARPVKAQAPPFSAKPVNTLRVLTPALPLTTGVNSRPPLHYRCELKLSPSLQVRAHTLPFPADEYPTVERAVEEVDAMAGLSAESHVEVACNFFKNPVEAAGFLHMKEDTRQAYVQKRLRESFSSDSAPGPSV